MQMQMQIPLRWCHVILWCFACQGVGSIRNWSHVRAGFHRIQSELQGKLLTP